MGDDPRIRFVTSDALRLRCVAGPGTGKTKALRERVERLLESGAVSGRRVFAVTFTRQAAAQLKENLTKLNLPGAEDITASTLHSYAFKILGMEGAIQALGRYPRPCFEYELAPFHHDVSKKVGGVKASKKLLLAFEAMWARLQNETPGWAAAGADNAFNEAYLSWMRFHRSLVIGELIPLAVQYLRQNPVNDVKDSFNHILVDEYQDLNRADQELIALMGPHAQITIVGDDDQSIYSFRHANPEGIRVWYGEQPKPKEDVTFSDCLRCDGRILRIANYLIALNPARLQGPLKAQPGREDSGEIRSVQWNTRSNETRGIAKGIRLLLAGGDVPADETVLVLVPRHEFARHLGDELHALGVSDYRVHAKPDWGDPTLTENLALMTLVNSPGDRVSLRYLLGLGDKQWLRIEYAKLRTRCEKNDSAPRAVLDDGALCLKLGLVKLRDRWIDLSARLRQLGALSEGALLDSLLPLDGPTESIGAAVRKLRAEDADASLTELLVQAVISAPEMAGEAKVNILTYYGAKGLTCHTVIVTSLVNGLLPANSSPLGAENVSKFEEERRLMYVAITRAKHRVILSSFRKATRGENAQLKLGLTGDGFYLGTGASRFLGELGPGAPPAVPGDDWLRELTR